MKTNVHILISGRVQGVWFRATTKQVADQIGVKGWVRNTSNGCVEAVFEGEEKRVDEIVEWCHSGPPMAIVEKVKVEKQAPTNSFEGFSIR
jgi:acylphosphatase